MKKLLLICATIALLGGLSLRAYFTFVPPPEPTLNDRLLEIIPEELNGWKIKDQDMAESPESSERISNFLNFDDALFRIFSKGDTTVGLYIAYWMPGKASYRWAGAHTPDTCWVLNGWTRLEREYAIPLYCNGFEFKPAEFGVYEKDVIRRTFISGILWAGPRLDIPKKAPRTSLGPFSTLKNTVST